MPYKTILVPIDGTDAAMPAIETAFMVGRQMAAHVGGLHVRADSKDAVPLLGEGMSGAMIEEIIELAEHEARDRAGKARKMFEDYCAANGIPVADKGPGPAGRVSAGWAEEIGREDEVVARRGRLFDLIVVSRPTGAAEPPAAMTLNAALFETGRPVLTAPPKTAPAIGRKVAISWNGSAQAARAVAGGMPFITGAETVTILTAESPRTAPALAAELAAYLAWHGVNAATQEVAPAGRSVGEALLKACLDLGGDLLVMGAYTHSRLRQLILGGVTRHMLADAPIPVLMGH